MDHTDNYAVQARQARQRFCSYDQEAIIRKLRLEADSEYLYTQLLSKPYRIHRVTGDIQRQDPAGWVTANTYNETMTLLDLVCDSRPDRFISGRWKQMQSFGLMFHQNLLEHEKDPRAELFQQNPDKLRKACAALKGIPMHQGDVSFAIELFDGLRIWLQFWEGDEEFPPRLRFLWDENALQYLKYETMYFAVPLLLQRIRENMDT